MNATKSPLIVTHEFKTRKQSMSERRPRCQTRIDLQVNLKLEPEFLLPSSGLTVH